MNNDFKLKLNHELKNIRKLINDPVLLLTIIFSLAVVTFFVLVPLWNILLESLKIGKGKIGLENYIESFTASGNFQVILNTILLGFVTSIISLIIGFFFAYVSVYIKIKGKKIFDFIAMLPIISPPFVIALSAIMLFGRQGIITSRMLGMKGFEIYGFHGLVLVQVLSFFADYRLVHGHQLAHEFFMTDLIC